MHSLILILVFSLSSLVRAQSNFNCGQNGRNISLEEKSSSYVITFDSNPKGIWPVVQVNEVLGIEDETEQTRLTFAKKNCSAFQSQLLTCRGTPLKVEYSKYWSQEDEFLPLTPTDMYFQIRERNEVEMNNTLNRLLEVEIAADKSDGGPFLRTTVEFKKLCK